MRTCREYEAFISAFIDGCLPEADRAELEAHMAACPVCQAYFDDQIAIHEALMDLEDVPAPEGLAGRIMDRVRTEAQERPAPKRAVSFPSWRRWAALAACCAVVAAGLWGFGRGSRAENQAAPQMAADDTAVLTAGEGGQTPMDRAAGVPAEHMLEPAAPEEEKAAMADLPAPAMAAPPAPAPTERDQDAADIYGAQKPAAAGTLTTASPIARAWVEEQLGLAWTSERVYELTAEEYGSLRAALAEAGEDFTETAGQPEAERYLLVAAG